MMRRLAAFVFAVAASATLPALADAYTFTAGTAIPLKDNDAQASWVTTNKQVGEYNLEGDRNGAATLTLTLNNSVAGNYVLVFQGVNQSMETTLTLSATDNSSYSRSATITQPKSSTWSDFTEHMFLLDDLPAGDFTLSFSAKPITGTSWNGGYKDFTFYKLDESPYSLTGTPYDIVSNPGTALSLAEGQTNGRLTLTGTEINISTKQIEEQFKALSSQYSIVMVTHILRQARRLADYVVFMYLGELIEHGPAEKIFNSPEKEMTRRYIKGDMS